VLAMAKGPRVHNRKSSVGRRRELRNSLTPAETLLWANLKNSRLGGKKFRRQHGIGPYMADFYCPECRVIVELDGAGHCDELARERDDWRTMFLEGLGMRVIRFKNWEVLKNLQRVLESIRAALESTGASR
jgi:very-short-patch-repair endonuclease